MIRIDTEHRRVVVIPLLELGCGPLSIAALAVAAWTGAWEAVGGAAVILGVIGIAGIWNSRLVTREGDELVLRNLFGEKRLSADTPLDLWSGRHVVRLGFRISKLDSLSLVSFIAVGLQKPVAEARAVAKTLGLSFDETETYAWHISEEHADGRGLPRPQPPIEAAPPPEIETPAEAVPGCGDDDTEDWW